MYSLKEKKKKNNNNIQVVNYLESPHCNAFWNEEK